jgi:transcriptional regulator with XRE-family HTH domain
MEISSKQIRAARGLLNISQKELAEKANLSINSLNNIEREVGSPRIGSLKLIEDALTSLGIEFLDKDGVRLSGEELKIKRIEGKDLVTRFYDEILRAYPTGNGEVLVMGKDNSRLHHHDPALMLAYKNYEEIAMKNNITERALFLENDTNFLSRRNVYRWVPPELFSAVPMMIFGNNVAILLWGPPKRMIVIRNPGIAQTFRRQFDVIWKLAKSVPDNVHKQHYQAKTQKVLDQLKKNANAKTKQGRKAKRSR